MFSVQVSHSMLTSYYKIHSFLTSDSIRLARIDPICNICLSKISNPKNFNQPRCLSPPTSSLP